MGDLYLVSTPIGNLEDITLRALKTLKSVQRIAAEDTRTTRVLLSHYDIHTPLTSNQNWNEKGKIDELLSELALGDLAIVSDAGTPLINDPGYPLVLAAIQAGFRVIPIPGASSPITALSVSGLPADQFIYLGYIPRKTSERKQFLQAAKDYPCTLVCLETPHRIVESLQAIQEILGDRSIAVCRELTKLYEEVIRGRVSQAIDHFSLNEPRGEFTLVIAGKVETNEKWSEQQMTSTIQDSLRQKQKVTDLSREVSKESGWSKKEIYQLAESLKK